jgi:peptidoglycan/LPS O-acetylase OafA/YrhL
MNAAAVTHLPAPPRHGLDRVRATLAAVGAAVLGAAPHMLHHAGPLAGAALLAGFTGRLVFGALGLLLAIPMLRRLHRRRGSWAVPGGVLALMAVVFLFSSFVIGPALTDSGGGSTTPATKSVPSAPPGVSPAEHEAHHR